MSASAAVAVQALLANIAGMYGVYHGPDGLLTIARRTAALARTVAAGAEAAGHSVARGAPFFDTVCVSVKGGDAAAVCAEARKLRMNFRPLDGKRVTIALDETTTLEDVDDILAALNGGRRADKGAAALAADVEVDDLGEFARQGKFMQHTIFNSMRSEHDLLRYLKMLENRDLSLCHSMIPLGSCTMKLNATAEMVPVSWPELANLHPFCPPEQAQGYHNMFAALAQQLCEITGFDSVSLQPNAGAAGEYAGLMAIRAFHQARCPCWLLLLLPLLRFHTRQEGIRLYVIVGDVSPVPRLCNGSMNASKRSALGVHRSEYRYVTGSGLSSCSLLARCGRCGMVTSASRRIKRPAPEILASFARSNYGVLGSVLRQSQWQGRFEPACEGTQCHSIAHTGSHVAIAMHCTDQTPAGSRPAAKCFQR